MKVQPAGMLLHFGLMSPVFTGLVVLAACVGGGWAISKLVPPQRRPVVEIIEVPGVAGSEGAAKYPTGPEMTLAPARESLVVAQSWAFESTSDTPVHSNTSLHSAAKKRADLLSAPEGWTYEAGASE